MSFRIADAASFRPSAHDVQLPSQQGGDECVRLRRPDLVGLIAAGDGDVPDVLSGMILGMLQGNKTQRFEVTAETLPQMMQSLDVIAVAAFVEPRLTRDAEPTPDGALPVSWLSFADKSWVFSWALGGEQAASAQRFPDASPGSAGAVPAVQDVQPQPKRGARNRR